jgi:hypothetical protein
MAVFGASSSMKTTSYDAPPALRGPGGRGGVGRHAPHGPRADLTGQDVQVGAATKMGWRGSGSKISGPEPA